MWPTKKSALEEAMSRGYVGTTKEDEDRARAMYEQAMMELEVQRVEAAKKAMAYGYGKTTLGGLGAGPYASVEETMMHEAANQLTSKMAMALNLPDYGMDRRTQINTALELLAYVNNNGGILGVAKTAMDKAESVEALKKEARELRERTIKAEAALKDAVESFTKMITMKGNADGRVHGNEERTAESAG